MTTVRSAPEFLQRAYHRALVTLPLRSTRTEVPEASSLTVLGEAVVDGREIAFGTRSTRPKLWISTAGAEDPRVIGHLTGLVLGMPELWICDDASWEWVNSGAVSAQLKEAAARVWADCVRNCDG